MDAFYYCNIFKHLIKVLNILFCINLGFVSLTTIGFGDLVPNRHEYFFNFNRFDILSLLIVFKIGLI